MPCYHPLIAYRLASGAVVFVERGDVVSTLELPCGQCIGCRLERSRQWAVRCMHEAQLHRHNAFVTLTYDDSHLPLSGSLVYSDFQLFMKRLRKRLGRVRFYMAGEYGSENWRPHFHALLFGCEFPDLYYWRTKGRNKLYRSAMLEELWTAGSSEVGEVTFQSASYVARYCMEKVTGDPAAMHYAVVDPRTGEMVQRVPEFNHMSLKPGIGAEWLEKYREDVYPSGLCVVNGRQMRPPKFYDRRFKREDPDAYEALCFVRDEIARAHRGDNTVERLGDKELVARARVALLKRG